MSSSAGPVQIRVRIGSSPWPETVTGGTGVTGGPKLHFQGALEKEKRFSWKRYWFVLHEDKLSYFKNERMSSAVNQGLIDLGQAQTVKFCATNRGYPFEICTRGKRHVLSAESSSLRDQWVSYLQRAMSLKRPVSEFTASINARNTTCNSIEDVDGAMYEQLNAILAGRSFSSAGTELSTEDSCSNTSDPSSPLSDPFSELEPSSTTTTRNDGSKTDFSSRDSGCEHGEDATGLRDSSGLQYDPKILRNKKAVARLHPTVSNAEASKFIYDSIHEDNVFTSSEKDSISAKDSGLSGMSCSSSLPSPSHSQASSMYEDTNFQFPAVPELPNPRLEMNWGSSPFDQIRLFLANNRGPDEFFPTPDKCERGGKAMQKLKSFLASLE